MHNDPCGSSADFTMGQVHPNRVQTGCALDKNVGGSGRGFPMDFVSLNTVQIGPFGLG